MVLRLALLIGKVDSVIGIYNGQEKRQRNKLLRM